MYSIGIAASILGVCIKTLIRWHRAHKIYYVRTPGGHRRFPLKELQRLLEGRYDDVSRKNNYSKISNTCAIHGRVSSHK